MRATILTVLLVLPAPGFAGAPSVTGAQARQSGSAWRFDVTVAHSDEGWEHYADAWRIAAPDGTVLGTRELAHPHVSEQPFTRSLGNVAIPAGVSEVEIRARDSVHGWGEAFLLTLPDS